MSDSNEIQEKLPELDLSFDFIFSNSESVFIETDTEDSIDIHNENSVGELERTQLNAISNVNEKEQGESEVNLDLSADFEDLKLDYDPIQNDFTFSTPSKGILLTKCSLTCSRNNFHVQLISMIFQMLS